MAINSKVSVCVLGASGSGKSTYGQYVLDTLGIPAQIFNGDMERITLLQSYDAQTAEKLLSQKFKYLKNDAISKEKSYVCDSLCSLN